MIQLKRIPQPGKTECGPAAVCAIANYLGYEINVDTVVNIIGVENVKNGTSVRDLAKSVDIISGGKLVVLYKYNGSIDEIRMLNEKDVPVAVDWQGSTFDDDEGGRGHYGVVTDTSDFQLTMVDSLPEFVNGRKVTFDNFLKLWWDTDSVVDKQGQLKEIKTNNLFFIIVPKSNSDKLQNDFVLSLGSNFGIDPS
jgi:ABC-type bacteriocin/lantibiotic exporter with double-glycine peptidase domain